MNCRLLVWLTELSQAPIVLEIKSHKGQLQLRVRQIDEVKIPQSQGSRHHQVTMHRIHHSGLLLQLLVGNQMVLINRIPSNKTWAVQTQIILMLVRGSPKWVLDSPIQEIALLAQGVEYVQLCVPLLVIMQPVVV